VPLQRLAVFFRKRGNIYSTTIIVRPTFFIFLYFRILHTNENLKIDYNNENKEKERKRELTLRNQKQLYLYSK